MSVPATYAGIEHKQKERSGRQHKAMGRLWYSMIHGVRWGIVVADAIPNSPFFAVETYRQASVQPRKKCDLLSLRVRRCRVARNTPLTPHAVTRPSHHAPRCSHIPYSCKNAPPTTHGSRAFPLMSSEVCRLVAFAPHATNRNVTFVRPAQASRASTGPEPQRWAAPNCVTA